VPFLASFFKHREIGRHLVVFLAAEAVPRGFGGWNGNTADRQKFKKNGGHGRIRCWWGLAAPLRCSKEKGGQEHHCVSEV
jgi:hypothetical protein